MPFDPNKHLIDLKGKAYLPVAARVAWFREDHPDWRLVTKIIEHEVGQYALCEAEVYDGMGNVLANAHKLETMKGFSDYIEKAGTGAIGRALALCGYGTQFAGEMEEAEDRPADAPQAKPAQRTAPNVPPADERKKLAAAIQDDWKARSEADPAMRFAARKKASILKAAKEGLISTPDINEASDGQWVLKWLDMADISDIKAYGKHNRKRRDESRQIPEDEGAVPPEEE